MRHHSLFTHYFIVASATVLGFLAGPFVGIYAMGWWCSRPFVKNHEKVCRACVVENQEVRDE